ncbi:MAG TPA: polyprenyl synthetase family protein [Sporichthyaceae bacterium]|jgi:geranylgeranyl diphosphate synthase type I
MTDSPTGAPRGLADARRLVEPALRAAVDRLDPTTRNMTGYHFGWLEADGSPATADGGKSVRSLLALLGARAVGADPAVAVPGAVAVELVHNSSLLHDDLIDADAERRHRKTVWAVWGAPSAILVGDALLALAQEVLVEHPAGRAAARLLAVATRELIRGQVEDMAYESRPEVALSAVLAMADAKTAALLSASAAIGAALADAPAAAVDALAGYGRHLGLAFQLVDDVLGIWGDPAVTGKPLMADLRSRKTSLPVARVISADGPAGTEVARWLVADSADSDADLTRIADLLEQGGGRAWARTAAAEHAAAAAAALDRLPDAPAAVLDELRELAAFVVGRDA